VLATGEGTGAVSWLDFAFRLMYLPIGLFGVSIATAATPAVSRMVAEGDLGRLRSTMASAIGLMMLLNVPATLGLMVLARPIVSVLFERGSFTASDTDATAAALQFYAIGLVGYSIVRIVSPTFYALRRSRIPVMVSAGSVVINIALNLALVRVFGYRGLALGTSITALVNAATQLWLLRREIHGIEGGRIASTAIRVVIAALFMAVAAWGTDRLLAGALPGRALMPQIVRLVVSIGIALAVLAAAAQLLRIREFGEARDLIVGRVRRMIG
jgi:putative peptidoglycan lipid II flippase